MKGPENKGFSSREEEEIPFAVETSDSDKSENQSKNEGKVDINEWLNSTKSGNADASKSKSRGGDLDRNSDYFGGNMIGK